MTGPSAWRRATTTTAAAIMLLYGVVACSDAPSATSGGASTDPDTVIADSILLLPGEPTAPVQSVALTQHYDQGLSSTVYELVRLDGVSDEAVWRTPPLGSETYRVPLASDGSRVLTAIAEKVYAFDLGSGQALWEAALTDVFQPSCEDCFDVIDGQLIVRSYDSVIHGIDTTTGEIEWSHRLEDVSGGSRVIGSHLLLVDGFGDNTAASVIDPATGSTSVALPASCSAEGGSDWARPLTDDATMLPSSSEPDLAYLGYGLIPACWQKWNLATGTQMWDTLLPDDYLDGEVVTVLDEPTLTFSTRNPSLAQLDTTTGAGSEIPTPPDMEITPIARVGNQVIARSVSTRGTPKWSIVSLDAGSGNVTWSTPLDQATPVDDFSSSVSTGETAFIDHVDGDRLRLVFLSGDDGLSSQTISLTDGSTTGRAPVAFTVDDSSYPSFTAVGWRGPKAVVVAYTRLLVIDTNTSSVTWSY